MKQKKSLQKDNCSKDRKMEMNKDRLIKESAKSSQIKSYPKDVSKINQDKINLGKVNNLKSQPTKWVVKKKQIEVLKKNNISKKALFTVYWQKPKNIEVMQVSLVVENPPQQKIDIEAKSTIENTESKLTIQENDISEQQKKNNNLALINELTGEDTTSTKSWNKLDTSGNANSGEEKHESSKKSWDFRTTVVDTERVDSFNNFTINSPLIRDEVEDLDEFVKNITINWKEHSESDSDEDSNDLELDEIKESEENVLEIEYYGLNRSNISKDSLLQSSRKNKISYLDQLDLESKRSKTNTSNFLDSSNILNIHKDQYSSSIMDLHKGDIQSESSRSKVEAYHFKREVNTSEIKIGWLDSLEYESNNYSFEISESHNLHTQRKFDYSNFKEEFAIKGIHDFLAARHHKRKHSLQEQSPNLIKHAQEFKQKTEDGVDDEELFKISWDKTSENSFMFNLNISKTKDHKSAFAKVLKEESDAWKDECSTLKEYSNLHSSKVYSICETLKLPPHSRNNDGN